MKKTVLLMLLVLLVAGCHKIHHQVAGSGNRVKQQRDLPSFTSISSQGAFDIDVVCQKTQSIEIEADDNLLPLISVEVSNNVLHVRSLKDYSAREPITLRISVTNLEGISVSGAGMFEVSGLKNEKFEIDASGAPTIKASGETKFVDIDTSGAGTVDTHNLRAAEAVVDAKGVAKVDVYASEKLDVTVSGPSHVTYEGNAEVNRTMHGPGTIEKKKTEGA